MTDLQKIYKASRDAGHKHRATLRAMSRVTGIDEGSISRALARARREDERDAKRAKREAQKAAA